ncbi:hypothetical protein Ahy_B06g084213 [Arachis hypogaea]|uniref:Cellulose synthase RING-type zinc finger domain-containing protein n=1 Tax=Arachis hypogaea TaxID=3818 RepID=A0A444YRE1_ARAHY|nr:hypothetical protein Ahy_B06g084213 [Arachis hypogaea]
MKCIKLSIMWTRWQPKLPKPLKNLNVSICQICGETVGLTDSGDFVVLVMNTSERIYQCCLQCKTKYKRHKGSPRVDGDEDVDDVDDLANEFSYGQGKSPNNAISHSRVAQGAKLRGASRIIGMDKNPQKCEKGAKISPEIDLNIVFSPSTILGSLFVIVFVIVAAKAFRFTEVVDPSSYQEPIAQVIKRITDGGTDFSFECVGDTDMITTALQSCCDGWGLTVTLGVPKEIQIDDYITHNLPFDDINNAFDLRKEGKCLRCVIHMPR